MKATQLVVNWKIVKFYYLYHWSIWSAHKCVQVYKRDNATETSGNILRKQEGDSVKVAGIEQEVKPLVL